MVKPDYTAAAVPPDSEMAKDPSTPTLGDLWRVGAPFSALRVVAQAGKRSSGYWACRMVRRSSNSGGTGSACGSSCYRNPAHTRDGRQRLRPEKSPKRLRDCRTGVIRANGGDSWCICMWGRSLTESSGKSPKAFARMVEAVGCENVHLRCNATDLEFARGQVACVSSC